MGLDRQTKHLVRRCQCGDRDALETLFVDGHVRFESRPTCGIENDNIYTIALDAGPGGRSQGRLPRVYETAAPLNHRDSVLVQETATDIPASSTNTGHD